VCTFIPVTWESRNSRLSRLIQAKSKTLSQKLAEQKRLGGMAEVPEHLPCKELRREKSIEYGGQREL
jgi:hypothetical protein